ncbi:MAG: hypothetical protein M1423_01140 [Acidobacteria bacterium]|nr:hypothetical protein [Acidobacteriota bacterium]
MAMVTCFAEGATVPHNSPGTVATVVMGTLLLRRALVISQPPIVAVAGCVVTAIIVLGDRGMNMPPWLWYPLAVAGFAVFGWWERIEKLWKKYRSA